MALPGLAFLVPAPRLATTPSSVTSGQRQWPFLPVLTLQQLLRGGECHPRVNVPRVLAKKDDNAALAHTAPTTSVTLTLPGGEWAGG